MSTLFDLTQTLKTLIKEKNYSDAYKLLNENLQNFSLEQIRSDKFFSYQVIYLYIKTNMHQSIFDFINEYDISLESRTFAILLNQLQKSFKENRRSFPDVVNNFCDLVSVNQLDTSKRTYESTKNGRKKTIKLASDKENWFMAKANALYELKDYSKCIEVCNLALESIEDFSLSNDIWLSRKIALSKYALGNNEEAIDIYLKLLNKKNEWFIQYDIAVIYKDMGYIEESFKYAIQAINSFGKLESKVKLIQFLADLLQDLNENELSFKHYSLARIIRIQNQWSITESLSNKLKQFEYPEITIEKLPELKKELFAYWNSFKIEDNQPSSNERLHGRIDKIMHINERGMDGFIKTNNSKNLYFNLPATSDLLNVLKEGSAVSFEIYYDKAKNKEKAVNIKNENK